MEYILVRFDPNDIRDVLTDGYVLGPTERRLTLRAGVYEITLSGSGYQPAKWSGSIAATTSTSPMEIVFGRLNQNLPEAPANGRGLRMKPGSRTAPGV